MTINVKTSQSCYDIIIENGAFEKLYNYTEELTHGKKIFAVTDDNVDLIYGKKLEDMFCSCEFKKIVLPSLRALTSNVRGRIS